MNRPPLRILNIVVAALLTLMTSLRTEQLAVAEESFVLRVATFNTSLNRDRAGELIKELEQGDSAQASQVAEILRRVRADVILLNEFDYDQQGRAADAFQKLYLERHGETTAPIRYPHRFLAPVNTGVPSGMDLNGDGDTTDPDDAFGFGRHPGQYGMLVLSRYPIDHRRVRTFQKFLWSRMPNPERPQLDGQPYYQQATFAKLRLASKSFWDVPIKIGEQTIHALVSHPTPPVFDGPEDRNGARNHDEIRLLADYVTKGRGAYLIDDQGRSGGLGDANAAFVILGDLNADPIDGDSRNHPTRMLLQAVRVNGDVQPSSRGAEQAARSAGGANPRHQGQHQTDTAAFNPNGPGNLRVDYALPSRNLTVMRAGVYWPPTESPQAKLLKCSDHRAVWLDVVWPPRNEK